VFDLTSAVSPNPDIASYFQGR